MKRTRTSMLAATTAKEHSWNTSLDVKHTPDADAMTSMSETLD